MGGCFLNFGKINLAPEVGASENAVAV